MSSSGVNKRKWVRLLIVLLIAIVAVSVLSIFLLYQVFWIWLDSLPSTRPDPSEDEYLQKILLLQETSDTVRVGDVFDFEFDEAYVIPEPYGDEASYLEELGVETAVPIFRWDTGGHYRIFFIMDQCIIYDFVYDIRQADTLQKGMTIYPDTTMYLTEAFYGDGDRYLQIAFDYSNSDGSLEYTVISSEKSRGIRIDYIKTSGSNIDIPQKIDIFSVTQIGDSAFYQNPCASVSLPSTLKVIGDSAFYRCHNIKEITIPAKTVSIGNNPFFRCSGLETIRVEEGNPNYCDIDGILYDVAGITLIAYPEGRKETVFEIPEGVTSIAEEAFGYSSDLQTIIIPESVTNFPNYNLFETYKQISFVVVSGSVAEAYVSQYNLPFRTVG